MVNEIIEKLNEEVCSGGEMSFLDQEVKTEPHDEILVEVTPPVENIKAEVFEESDNSEPFVIIGEINKIKEEFVVFEESDYKEESQEIEEINLGASNNQVTFVQGPVDI